VSNRFNYTYGRQDIPRVGRLTKASTIKLDRPRWVWDRRIPVGGTTLMAGREGMGKTALVCWIAGQLTCGSLPGEWEGRPADVVYIGHEDDRATVLNPRLEAAGADRDRFHFFDIDEQPFTVAQDVDALTETLRGRPVALVVFDPLDAHLGGQIDSNRDKAKVQATIGNLARLAQELRCGTLGLGHLNKAPIADLLTKVIGSVGFTTSVRSVLAIGEHPDNGGEKVCVVAKANMTDRSKVAATRFNIEGYVVDHPDDDLGIDTGRVVVLGEELGINPNSLLVTDGDTRSRVDHAQGWLKQRLATGPVPWRRLKHEADAAGISKDALHRARKRWGDAVVIDRDETARGQPSTWRLVSSQPPCDETPCDETQTGSEHYRQTHEGGFIASSQGCDETSADTAYALLEEAFGTLEDVDPDDCARRTGPRVLAPLDP
jgi:hypothetical protein